MGIGLSLILIAAGAVLAWAVDYQTTGIDLNAAGVVLVIVGAIGLVVSMVLWSSLGTWMPGREVRTRPTTVYEEPPVDHVIVEREVPVAQREVHRTVTRETNYSDPRVDPPVRHVR
ncbi:hypothetical protein AYO38_02535 [bacterium SCGC AG-212-C10]|nr:hypothetical protein AYO38_02535 [bacterium SCGC AG-212-C10]